MAHRLVQRGDMAKIYRISDGGLAFSGSALNMHNIMRRMQASSKSISDLVERRMKSYRNGAPWKKYKDWLFARGISLVEEQPYLTNEEIKLELVGSGV